MIDNNNREDTYKRMQLLQYHWNVSDSWINDGLMERVVKDMLACMFVWLSTRRMALMRKAILTATLTAWLPALGQPSVPPLPHFPWPIKNEDDPSKMNNGLHVKKSKAATIAHCQKSVENARLLWNHLGRHRRQWHKKRRCWGSKPVVTFGCRGNTSKEPTNAGRHKQSHSNYRVRLEGGKRTTRRLAGHILVHD